MNWLDYLPSRRLHRAGIVGMNSRNGDYIARYNARRLYPLVDNKMKTKDLAQQAGIAVPELYGVVRIQHDLSNLRDTLAGHRNFVIKPAHGAGGDGIIVVRGRQGDDYLRASGEPLSHAALEHHVSNILSGMFSLGGLPDEAMIEYCVDFDPVFAAITHHGVPDIRTLVFRGVPVCAMVRLPTRESDGKANLHQGAVGAGIDLHSGRTTSGVHHNAPVSHHPDTGQPLGDFQIPHWPRLLELATRCYELAPLGYLGVDVVLDRQLGPLVLELNARPGLSIQLANGRGIGPELRKLAQQASIPTDPVERIRLTVPDFVAAPEAAVTAPRSPLADEFYF